MRRHWSPLRIPHATRHAVAGAHAEIIHACSDTLRKYCESLWYSGLEFKRPTDEEIVIHAIRSIMDWLDATENRAFQVLSIYEMHSQIPHFTETIADYAKALKICEQLLLHLGSVFHRIHPLKGQDYFLARSLVDFQALPMTFKLHANQCYPIGGNKNSHVWQLCGSNRPVPSLFLEVSTALGEHQMLKKLRKRFDDFLLTSHGRSRRQLLSRLSEQLKITDKSATVPNLNPSISTEASTTDGFYFPRSPHQTKRRSCSSSSPRVLRRQNTSFSCAAAEDVASHGTIRRMLLRLRTWLHQMPSPLAFMNEKVEAKSTGTPRCVGPEYSTESDVVDEVYRWWSVAAFNIKDARKIDRIVQEACFLRDLNEIMQITVDIGYERSKFEREAKRRDRTGGSESFSSALIAELISRLGEPFYHPRSGRVSYRWTQRSMDRSTSPSPASMTGTHLFTCSLETRQLSSALY